MGRRTSIWNTTEVLILLWQENKKFNRKAEFAYQNEEMYAMLDAQTAGGAYPEKELHEAGSHSA